MFRPIRPLALAILILGCAVTAEAQPLASIFDINSDLSGYAGTAATVTGVWISTEDGTFLWTHHRQASETHSLNWNQRLRVTDGGAMPPLAETFTYGVVRVTGTISVWTDTSPPGELQNAGSIAIDSFVLVTPPPPPLLTTPPPRAGLSSAPPAPFEVDLAPCDSCHFVVIVSGTNEQDYWNDVTQKYDYKHNTLRVCDSNIVVLYAGGSRVPAAIPNGTLDGQRIASGGVFTATRARIDSAFAYIKRRMQRIGCSAPNFQFHTTGHGGGYHTAAGQQGYPKPGGYMDGIVDTSGDESTLSENDLVFNASYCGARDIDGDGDKDLWLVMVPNELGGPGDKVLKVVFDRDNDGSIDESTEVVGVDDNGDGVVDKNDPSWEAPDFNRNGATDAVGFDETIGLLGEEELTDDALAALLRELRNGTSLAKDSTRVELAQCFSGGFQGDLSHEAGEVATACGEGQVSYSERGRYNVYEKPFIAGLASGKSWKNAHEGAVGVILPQTRFIETPEYRANPNPGTTSVPWARGLEASIEPPAPNPMRTLGRFAFSLARAGGARLSIVDVQGRTVAVLRDEFLAAGRHETTWAARPGQVPVRPGLYFLRLETAGPTVGRKFVIQR